MEEKTSGMSPRHRSHKGVSVPQHLSEGQLMNKSKKIFVVVGSFLALFALVGAVIGGLFAAGILGSEQDDYAGSGQGEVLFTISEGEYGDAIASNLVESGVTKSFDAFYSLLLEQPEIVFIPGV